jgi:antirestriction protein ArdC
VRRGETALRIFAPCPPSKAKLQAWRDAGADPAEKPRTFFRLTTVFDRSQVDELPPPAEPAPLDPPAAAEIDGDELAPWLEPLTALGGEIGSTIAFESIASGADGFYRPKTKAIVVEATHPPNRRVKTLVHELAHALVRADHQDGDPELDQAAGELVAETVAYSVCASSGIDPGAFSIGYLAGWSEQTPIATIEHTAALIDRLSRRIEEAIAPVTLSDSGNEAAAPRQRSNEPVGAQAD